MKHELKTDPEVYDDVKNGYKTFEIRMDNRDYKVDDTLILQKTKHTGKQMANGAPLVYTGDKISLLVIYILKGPIYGLEKGWVIMSIKRIINN